MNNCTFVGRLGGDAEVRKTNSGLTVTGFSLAVTTGYGDNKGTLWLDCSIWGDRGERIAHDLKKGAEIVVAGELAENEYVNKEGATVKKLTFRVNSNSYPKNKDPDEQAPQQAALDNAAMQQGALDNDAIPF